MGGATRPALPIGSASHVHSRLPYSPDMSDPTPNEDDASRAAAQGFDAQAELDKLEANTTEADVERAVAAEPAILEKAERGPLRKFLGRIRSLFGLLRSYVKGDYRKVPWSTVAAGAGVLLYVLSPLDAIPDFIPGAGLIDDAAVLGLALKLIGKDLDDYGAWRDARKRRQDGEPS